MTPTGSRPFTGRLTTTRPRVYRWQGAAALVAPPPPWLTPAHWAPLALQDFGDSPMVCRREPRGLISANLACRKRLFERVGGFSPPFQRVKDGIGSLEDDEWIRRLWKAGRALSTSGDSWLTDVPEHRLTRQYHRRWHRATGAFMRCCGRKRWRQTSRARFWGVRLTCIGRRWRRRSWDLPARGTTDEAFTHEVRLRFLPWLLQSAIGGTAFPISAHLHPHQ